MLPATCKEAAEDKIYSKELIYLLTVRQAAQRLQLGVNRTYELTKAEHNAIPTVIVGRSIRIPVAGLERWLEEQTRG